MLHGTGIFTKLFPLECGHFSPINNPYMEHLGILIFWVVPAPRMPVAHEGLDWDPLLKIITILVVTIASWAGQPNSYCQTKCRMYMWHHDLPTQRAPEWMRHENTRHFRRRRVWEFQLERSAYCYINLLAGTLIQKKHVIVKGEIVPEQR